MTVWPLLAVSLLTLSEVPSVPGAAELGSLTVRSQPGVEVFWEGYFLSKTKSDGTLHIERIPPGTYPIRLRKEGYRELATQIDVVLGANEIEIRLVPVDLGPAPPPSAESPPGPPRSAPQNAIQDPVREPPETPADSFGGGSREPSATLEFLEPRLEPAAADPEPEVFPGNEPVLKAETSDQSTSSPSFYLFLLALLGSAGAYFLRRRRRARAQLLLEEARPRLLESDPVPDDPDSPTFLENLKRREVVLKDFFEGSSPNAERHIVEAEVLDVEFEETEGEG